MTIERARTTAVTHESRERRDTAKKVFLQVHGRDPVACKDCRHYHAPLDPMKLAESRRTLNVAECSATGIQWKHDPIDGWVSSWADPAVRNADSKCALFERREQITGVERDTPEGRRNG